MTVSSKGQESKRPLSPHLQIYKPQITSIMSILHRMTGVALFFGLMLFVCFLLSMAGGSESYTDFKEFASSPLGIIIEVGFTFALFYHLFNGIRHLAWDAGHGYNIKCVTKSGIAVLGMTFLATVLSWIIFAI